MSNIFDKKKFKNKEMRNKLINIKLYKKNLTLFNKDSLLGRVYPSLLSKSISFETGNYWEKKFNILRLINFKINPFKIVRLFISYFQIFLLYINCFLKRKKIICLLTRAQGIRKKYSIEDYRFQGLEEKLRKEYNIVYFFHGKKKSKFITDSPIIYSSDIYSLSRLIFILIYPFIEFNFRFRKKKFLIWNYDLSINLISSLIISLYTRFINLSFFWDFNYYHYPLFLGSFLTETKLIGSMHNFNYYGQLPWISDEIVKHLDINYKFNDYESIFDFIKKNDKVYFKSIKNLAIQNSKFNIVIIQENQTNQESLIKFIVSIKNKINKIYVKTRPDKDKTDLLINLLKFNSLNFDYIDDLLTQKTKDFFFFGTSSTLLLDLAAKNRIAISYSTNKHRFFDYPSRNFVELSDLNNTNDSNNQKFIENPIYVSNKKNFLELINKKHYLVTSNSTRNHMMFNDHKIDSIMNLISSELDSNKD